MNVRSYKWGIAILLCVTIFFGWRSWVLFGQAVTADFIDKECKITEGLFRDFPLQTAEDKKALAWRLEFLIGYYESRSNILAGSHLEQIVRRDYEQALTNALIAFRREATNDLGSDPRAWIQKYGK
ncbi:MAG: hypothetical protein AAB380_06315 [Verrucomicrobiota bacterium]